MDYFLQDERREYEMFAISDSIFDKHDLLLSWDPCLQWSHVSGALGSFAFDHYAVKNMKQNIIVGLTNYVQ